MATQVVNAVDQPAEQPVPSGGRIVIEPQRGWRFVNFAELWRCRELLLCLCWRDIKVRYKQTVFGVLWAVLQPAMMMLIFTVCIGRLAGVPTGDVPYPLFVFIGLLPWTFFATAVSRASVSVVGAEAVIGKVYFPRLTLPFAAVGVAFFDFTITLGLLAVVVAGYALAGMPLTLGPRLLAAPLVIGILILTTVGLGAAVAALNAAYRDLRQVIPFLLQFGMFATPTIYLQPAQEVDGISALLLTFNPLCGLVAAFRASVLGGPIPWGQVAVAAAIGAACFFLGCLYFRRVEDRFADVL